MNAKHLNPAERAVLVIGVAITLGAALGQLLSTGGL